MIRLLFCFLLGMLVCIPAWSTATMTVFSAYRSDSFIPKVRLQQRAYSLQKNLYPELYRTRPVAADVRWVTANDSALSVFWTAQGDTVLHLLTELTGIPWHEREFDIYLVRFFPTIGSSDPLVIPLGGINDHNVIEAAPSAEQLILSLVYQLSKRMLAQANQPEDSLLRSPAQHPLMQPGTFRLDNLAMLVTMSVCRDRIGSELTEETYNSAFWSRHFVGKELFDQHFKNRWILTPQKTLSDWLAEESYNSELVTITNPPRPVRPEGSVERTSVEGLPIRGELGLSTRLNSTGQLVVDKIDVYRAAYACGLRENDVVRRARGRMVRNQRELVEQILSGLDEKGAAYLDILREGRSQEIIVRPVTGFTPEEADFWDETVDSDSIPPDSTLVPYPKSE